MKTYLKLVYMHLHITVFEWDEYSKNFYGNVTLINHILRFDFIFLNDV